MQPRNVAIYIRWSTEDQSEGTTLAVQMESCTQYARSQGWAVQDDAIFIDDGYSGASLDRPALARLRLAVREGRVDCVVVFKLDRLSRSVMDMVNLVIGEWEGRCCVKSAREPIDTTTHAGRMFFYTLASFGEWERATIRERTLSGRARRAEAGLNPGMKAPFGYRWDEERRLELVPHEAAVVARVFALAIQGASCRRTADHLNATGMPTRSGVPWGAVQVSRILRNPIYTGTFAWGRSLAACPAIVGHDDFARASGLRAQRPRPGAGSGRALASPHLLSGLLTCALCGRRMSARNARRCYQYYRCGSSRGCASRAIRQELLDRLAVEAVLARYRARLARCIAAGAALGPVREELAAAEAALQRLREQVKKAVGQARYMRSLLRRQELPPREYRELMREIEAEQEKLQDRERLLLQQVAVHRSILARQAEMARDIGALDPWLALDPVQRKQLLRKFLAGAEVALPRDGHELRVTFHWRDPDACG